MSPNHNLQDDEMSDLSHSASLQPYVESAPNSPSPEPGPSCATREKSATYRLRFLAEMSAMTNFKRARKRIEEMGEVEAFKLIRSSSSAQRLAAKKELAAKTRREVEEMEQQASGRVAQRVQKRTRKPKQSGPMCNFVTEQPRSRRELIAMRRQKYFAKHSARLAEGFATPCVATAAVTGRASGQMSGPMCEPMSGPLSGDMMAESAVPRPLPPCPIRPVKDFNAPIVATGPMSSEVVSKLATAISAADDEMKMADLTKSMHGTSL